MHGDAKEIKPIKSEKDSTESVNPCEISISFKPLPG
jgi:hypothetical protein